MAEEIKNQENTEVETTVQDTQGKDITLADAKNTITNTYLKDNPLYNQIVYISNDQFDCVAVPFPKLDYTVRPFIVEEPKGIKHPKYNWSTFQWEEVEPADTYEKMVKLQDTVTKLTAQAESSAKSNAELASMLALATPVLPSEDDLKEGEK